MTSRCSLRIVELWNDSWFFRLNVIVVVVGLVYLLFF